MDVHADSQAVEPAADGHFTEGRRVTTLGDLTLRSPLPASESEPGEQTMRWRKLAAGEADPPNTGRAGP
jgi:hypothetical protein